MNIKYINKTKIFSQQSVLTLQSGIVLNIVGCAKNNFLTLKLKPRANSCAKKHI